MAVTESLLNIAVLLAATLPLLLLAWWVIRRTPQRGLSGANRWRAHRIRVGAAGLALLSAGLLVYFLVELIA